MPAELALAEAQQEWLSLTDRARLAVWHSHEHDPAEFEDFEPGFRLDVVVKVNAAGGGLVWGTGDHSSHRGSSTHWAAAPTGQQYPLGSSSGTAAVA